MFLNVCSHMFTYDASELTRLNIVLAAQKLAVENAQLSLVLRGTTSDKDWVLMEEWSSMLDSSSELEETLELNVPDEYKSVRIIVTTNSTVSMPRL